MKTTLLFLAACISFIFAHAQYSQNFEGGQNNLTSNCWTLTGVHFTNDPSEVISGSGSMFTNPLSGAAVREIETPALNVVSTSLTVSFNYKLNAAINIGAIRTIQVGLTDEAGIFFPLSTVTLTSATPLSVQSFNQTFTLASTGKRKLVLKFAGSPGGGGTTRIFFDDLSISANPLYGNGTCNTAPVAVNDVFSGINGLAITGDVKANDYDPNGELITPAIVLPSADGVVTLNPAGTFVFTPNPGFIGNTTSFTYVLTDNGLNPATSNVATVMLNYSSPIVLPIKLAHFSAQLNAANKVDLKWSTMSEINASHFVIEKSADGKNYSDAGVVTAFGNSNNVKNYYYSDNVLGADKSVMYYRLRMVDADGKVEYSSVRIIRMSNKENKVTMITYPNPFTSEVRITIPAHWQDKKIAYEILNVNGQIVTAVSVNRSSQTETINTQQLAPGLYFVKVNCNGETAQQKIIKQ